MTSTRTSRLQTRTTSRRHSTRAACVFKSGVQVVQNGEIVSNGHKRTLWVNAKVKENPQVMRDINEKFLKYYSITQANYEALGHHFVPNPYATRGRCNAGVGAGHGNCNYYHEKPACTVS